MDDAAVLRSRLSALRRMVRLAMVSVGVGRLLCAAAAVAAADFALDRALRLSAAARSVVLVVAAAALARLLARHVVAPLLRPLRPGALALELDRRTRGPGDILSSALQFAQEGVSGVLRARTVSRAETQAASIVPGALVRWRLVGRWLSGGVAAGLLLLTLAAAAPQTGSLWFRRNVLLATVEWPRRTRLVLAGAPAVVARGETAEVSVRAEGVVPRTARLEVRGAAGRRPATLLMERTGTDTFVCEVGPLEETVEVRVRAGDGLLEGERIVVVDRPEVKAAHMIVEPPGYIGDRPVELPWTSGVFEVPVGSAVTIELEATKALASARCRVGDSLLGSDPLRGGRSASFSFEVAGDVRCEVTLTDTFGVGSAGPLSAQVRAVEDTPPTVKLAASGVGELLVPDARVPLAVEATDDYGVEALWLEQTRAGGPEGPIRSRRALWEGAARPRAAADEVLELSEAPLAPGARLTVTGAARDNCAVDGPNSGHSAPLSFRIVTAHELLSALLLRQQDLRRDLEQQVERQHELRGLAGAGPEGEAAAAQRAVADVVGLTASGYRDVLAQMLNNRLTTEASHRARVGAVVEPLEGLSAPDGILGRAADALEGIGGASPASSGRLMEAALTQMELVRDRMMLLEDLSAVVASVAEIAEDQEELLRRTRASEQEVLDALGGGR